MTSPLRGEAPPGGGFHKKRLAGAALVIAALAVLSQVVDIGIPTFSVFSRVPMPDASHPPPPGGELPFFRGLSDDCPTTAPESDTPPETPTPEIVAAPEPTLPPPPPEATEMPAFEDELGSMRAQLAQLQALGGGSGEPAVAPEPDIKPMPIEPGPGILVPLKARSQAAEAASTPSEDHPVPTVFAHRSPYTLYEGTVIPITLLQGISSELPGRVCALVTQSLYDTISGEHLIIPRGSKLCGLYQGTASFASSRLGILWHRLILVDGRQVRLSDGLGADAAGISGAPGKVETRFWRILGAAALSTVFRVGVRATGGRIGSRDGTDAGQEVAVEASEAIGDAGGRVLERELSLKPLITIAAGRRLSVVTAHDLVIPPNRYVRR
jgi:type IV secretion system protein VirB10